MKHLAGEVLSDAQTCNNDTTYTVRSLKFRSSTGYACVKITLGTTSHVVVTQQCSTDDTNWYNPINASGTPIGIVGTFTTAGTYYVQFDPVMTPYIRFKMVENNTASTTFSLSLIYQEDATH